VRIGITCYPTYGGSGVVATELGIALAGRGHEIHFITYANPFRLQGFVKGVYFHEVPVRHYPLFDYVPYTLSLAAMQHEVAQREHLDLLHVHYAIPHATTGYLAKQMLAGERDLKVVTTLHGTDITLVGQDPSYKSITQFSIEQSDAVTAVSEYLRDETYRSFGCAGCYIEVIPNFVDPAQYRPGHEPECRSALGPSDHRVLLHISNFRPVKRVRDVVRIFARVRARMPATLVLVGDGPDRPEAEDEARLLGVSGDVRALGRIENVAQLIRCSDLVLLPSTNESFGLVALEALATGVPVVGSRAGGLVEVVTHGETGVLEPPGDVDAMAAGAIALLEDRAMWRRYSEQAIEHAQVFTTARIVPRYETLYHDVVAG